MPLNREASNWNTVTFDDREDNPIATSCSWLSLKRSLKYGNPFVVASVLVRISSVYRYRFNSLNLYLYIAGIRIRIPTLALTPGVTMPEVERVQPESTQDGSERPLVDLWGSTMSGRIRPINRSSSQLLGSTHIHPPNEHGLNQNHESPPI